MATTAWKTSDARRILYAGLRDKSIPMDCKPKDAYTMKAEFGTTSRKLWANRLRAAKKSVEGESHQESEKWRSSKAKRVLYKALKSGQMPMDITNDDAYAMFPEFAASRRDLWGGRLSAIKEQIEKKRSVAAEYKLSLIHI